MMFDEDVEILAEFSTKTYREMVIPPFTLEEMRDANSHIRTHLHEKFELGMDYPIGSDKVDIYYRHKASGRDGIIQLYLRPIDGFSSGTVQ